jgi:hypothetical protein
MNDYAATLAEFASLPSGWDSYDADPISDLAVVAMLAFLDAVHCPSFQLVPCRDGGIQAELHERGKDWELEVTPKGGYDLSFEHFDRDIQISGLAGPGETGVAVGWWRKFWLGEEESV